MKMIKIAVFILTLCLSSPWVSAALKVGDTAPGFKLKSLNGPIVSLDDLTSKGHVMLVFWETECVYCFMHIKDFNKIHDQYQYKGLTIAAINFFGEHENEVKEYVNDNHLKYLMLTDRIKNIDVASDYKVLGSPTIVIVSPEQKVLYYGHKIPDLGQWIKSPSPSKTGIIR